MYIAHTAVTTPPAGVPACVQLSRHSAVVPSIPLERVAATIVSGSKRLLAAPDLHERPLPPTRAAIQSAGHMEMASVSACVRVCTAAVYTYIYIICLPAAPHLPPPTIPLGPCVGSVCVPCPTNWGGLCGDTCFLCPALSCSLSEQSFTMSDPLSACSRRLCSSALS